MESLTETTWDVVLCGTGLQQSLLALALSRCDKKILHVDANDYYGGPEASFSLQEAEAFATAHAASSATATTGGMFRSAAIERGPEEDGGLSFSRAYTLSLSPAFIHARSGLIDLLVSSKAFRHLEFHAVGSFFVYEPPPAAAEPEAAASEGQEHPSTAAGRLTRIPSTREEVFTSTDLGPKAKRSLMKFLKFVLDHDSDDNSARWRHRANEPLEPFLESESKLDAKLRAYILALTLSPRGGDVSVKDGLAAIRRHMTSMGRWGPGFAALYPRWGGIAEVAQVGCRAAAVGGGVYALGTRVKGVRRLENRAEGEPELEINLENSEGSVCVKARTFVRAQETQKNGDNGSPAISRLVAVVNTPLRKLFQAVVEGAPAPVVAVVAYPPGSLQAEDGTATSSPVYVVAHSSETGECPAGQSVLHLSTPSTPTATEVLAKALSSVLGALTPTEEPAPKVLYRLSFEHACLEAGGGLSLDGPLLTLPPPRFYIAFDDGMLEHVEQAWEAIVKAVGMDNPGEYMVFEDREGVDTQDDEYE